jgi:hypothetical protein
VQADFSTAVAAAASEQVAPLKDEDLQSIKSDASQSKSKVSTCVTHTHTHTHTRMYIHTLYTCMNNLCICICIYIYTYIYIYIHIHTHTHVCVCVCVYIYIYIYIYYISQAVSLGFTYKVGKDGRWKASTIKTGGWAHSVILYLLYSIYFTYLT